jgi:uncharacterized protein
MGYRGGRENRNVPRLPMLPDDAHFITDEASLRANYPQPMLRATDKVLRALDKYCRRIIALSPFCVIATQEPNGADVSPRGDPAGFVRVVDDLTLLVPDRVGNNRLDTMTNLLVKAALTVRRASDPANSPVPR